MGVPITGAPVTLTGDSDTTYRRSRLEEDADKKAGEAHEQAQALTPKAMELEAQAGEDKEFYSNRSAAMRAEHDWVRQDAQRRADEEMASIAKEARELEGAGKTAEQNLKTGWQSLDTGHKLGAALAIALNGLGKAISGDRGPNEALNIFLNQWDRDRAEKREAIKRDYFDRAAELRGPARDRLLKELDRKLAVTDETYRIKGEGLLEEFNAMAARTGSEQKMLEAQRLSAEKRQKFQEDRVKSYDGLRSKHEHERKQVIPGGGAMSGPPDRTITDLAGKPIGVGRTLPEAEKIRDTQGATVALIETLNRLKAHQLQYGRTDIGGVIPLESSEVRAQREALEQEAVGYMGKLRGSGTLDHNEYARYRGGLSTSIAKGGEAAAGAIDSIIDGVSNKYSAVARSAAIIEPGASPSRTAPASAPATPEDALKRAAAPAPKGAPVAPVAANHSKALEWAKAHPDDPRAKEILRINGGR